MKTDNQIVYETIRFKTLLDLIYKQVGVTVFGKKTYALITNQSVSSVDKQISQCRDIATYKKVGNSSNARVLWNLIDVVEYLLKTVKVL